MAFGLGAAFKATRKLKRHHDLPKLIEDAEREASSRILDKYEGRDRFKIAIGLLDAAFTKHLEEINDHQSKLALKKSYIQHLRKELHMAAGALSNEPAMRVETAALGIAIKELAVTLDDQVEAFEQRSRALLSDHDRDFQRLVEETSRNADTRTASAIDSLTRQVNRQIDANRDSIQVMEREVRVSLDENGKRVSRLIESTSRTIDVCVTNAVDARLAEIVAKAEQRDLMLDEEINKSIDMKQRIGNLEKILEDLDEQHQQAKAEQRKTRLITYVLCGSSILLMLSVLVLFLR